MRRVIIVPLLVLFVSLALVRWCSDVVTIDPFVDCTSDSETCASNAVLDSVSGLLDVLDRLVKLPQLRFFRVRLDAECPFWAAHVLCMSAENPCAVCTCDEREVPTSLARHVTHEPLLSSYNSDEQEERCERTSSETPQPLDFVFKDSQLGMDEALVDLVMNPEGNTFYLGEMANKVWDAIYRENCFQLYRDSERGDLEGGGVHLGKTSCSGLHVLHRLVSGLHASISTHIAVHYFKRRACSVGIDTIRNVTYELFDPNEDELRRRVLDHSLRIENLLFLHRFVLRSVSIIAPSLRDGCVDQQGGRFYSADRQHDAEMCAALRTLFQDALLCSSSSLSFNENDFMASEEGRNFILPQVEKTLRNITALMDCLTCEKCRLWGKVQLTGLNAAVRVIFGSSTVGAAATAALSTREEVALVNLLRQLTFSVKAILQRNSIAGRF